MKFKTAAILVSLASLLLMPAAALADDSQLFSACDPSVSNSKAANSAICKDQGTATDPAVHIIHVAADIIALIAGLAAVLIIIASGIAMITSGGNSESVGNARKRILGAIIGLAIIAFAWVIVTFLTDKLIA